MASFAEQMQLAKMHCPDVLKKLEKAERMLAGFSGRPSVSEEIARARREIAEELTLEFWDTIIDARRRG